VERPLPADGGGVFDKQFSIMSMQAVTVTVPENLLQASNG